MANDIGSTLRDARIRARIDIAEVEAATKIRAKYLRAIENEEWDLLPGPVYVKSFLRTYGDYLGLDSRMLVEEFKRRYERPAEHELHPIAPVRRGRQPERERSPRARFAPPSWAVIVAVLALVVAVLAVIGLTTGNLGKNSDQTAGIHSKKHPQRHHAHGPKKTTTTTATTHKIRTVTLQLVPTAPVYVCLANGAGKKLIAGVIYDPGQTIPRATARELYLTLGNPSVQMKVNGKPVPVTPSSTPLGYRIRPRGTSLLPTSSLPFKCG
jgi:cytoskeleton protein RodZ